MARLGSVLLVLCSLAPCFDLAAQRAIPVLRAEREWRVDADAANLSRIGWLAVSGNGAVAVGQPQDHLVRFFDPQGKPLGTFGRKGAGPGDFQRVGRTAGWLGDTLWVSDDGAPRVTLISPARKLVRTVSHSSSIRASVRDTAGSASIGAVMALYSDGTQLLSAILPLNPATPRPSWAVSPLDTGSPAIFPRVAGDGMLRKLAAWSPADACGIYIGAHNTWCPRPLVVVAPDGNRLAFVTMADAATSGSYRVIMLSALGDTVFARRYPFTAQPIPRAVLDSLAAAGAREPRAPVPMLEWNKVVHRIYPPVTNIVIGRDRTLWLRLRAVGAEVQYLVLGPTGDPMGTVTVPEALTVLAADRGTVWGVEKDADDLEHLVRYRVR